MVRLFSTPDPEIFAHSHETVYLSELITGRDGLRVIPVTAIHSLVCMFPEFQVNGASDTTHTGKYALLRHPYIQLTQFVSDGSFGTALDEQDPISQ